jgi:hypothetical protein
VRATRRCPRWELNPRVRLEGLTDWPLSYGDSRSARGQRGFTRPRSLRALQGDAVEDRTPASGLRARRTSHCPTAPWRLRSELHRGCAGCSRVPCCLATEPVERATGIEPATFRLGTCCATVALRPRGSRGETRTPVILLNRQALLPTELPWNVLRRLSCAAVSLPSESNRLTRLQGGRLPRRHREAEPQARIELAACGLRNRCSTAELLWRRSGWRDVRPRDLVGSQIGCCYLTAALQARRRPRKYPASAPATVSAGTT